MVVAVNRDPMSSTLGTATELRAIRDVAVGDRVLALDGDTPVLSTVYYVPHESDRDAATRFQRVAHEPVETVERVTLDEDRRHVNNEVSHLQLVLGQVPQIGHVTFAFGAAHHVFSRQESMVLEITPDHLIYFDPRSEDLCERGDTAEDAPTSCQSSLAWTSERESDESSNAPPRHQKAARELAVNDTIFVLLGAPGERLRLVPSRVTRIESVVLRQGALTLYTGTGNFFVDGVLCSNFGDYYPVLPDRRRDLVPFTLFAAHRLAFALVPSNRTARVLRWIMDAVVLPVLRSALQHTRQ